MDDSEDKLIISLANAGATVSKIAKILKAGVDDVKAKLTELNVEAVDDTITDKASTEALNNDSTKDLDSEFDAIMAGAGLDDSALYPDGAKVVYVVETVCPGHDGLEPVRCTGKLSEAKTKMFEEVIKDVRDNNGLKLRQGPLNLQVGCLKIDLAQQSHSVAQQLIASIGFQPAWFAEKATVPLTEAEKAAATALLTGIRDGDKKALAFMYAAPVTLPDMVDFNKGEYIGDDDFM